jgi:hypothetical protein
LVHKNNGTVNRLTFIKSERTDKDFLRLYKYIDSISLNNSGNLFDTTKLKSDRDKLVLCKSKWVNLFKPICFIDVLTKGFICQGTDGREAMVC